MTQAKSPPILRRSDFEREEEYQEYLDVEAADYVDVAPASAEQVDAWKTLADQFIHAPREKISLNIPKPNLSRLKARALEQGLPYQTLINAVLHQWLREDQKGKSATK